MPPRKQFPAPVEEPQQEVKPARKGIVVNYDFNTTVPNYVFNPALWYSTKKGRKPSVDAMLCYMWCIDKVTSLFEDEDGTPTGKVLDGLPIGFAVIANDANLGISWSSVQRNMKYLEQVGLIRRVRGTIKDKYSYEVLTCRKQFNGKRADGTIRLGGKTYTDKGVRSSTVAAPASSNDGLHCVDAVETFPAKFKGICPRCSQSAEDCECEWKCPECDWMFPALDVIDLHLRAEHEMHLVGSGDSLGTASNPTSFNIEGDDPELE
ncbi:MAG: hypothetical protein WBP71_11765 [Terracidiphilus sp.]